MPPRTTPPSGSTSTSRWTFRSGPARFWVLQAGLGMIPGLTSLVDRLLPDALWQRIQPVLPLPAPPRHRPADRPAWVESCQRLGRYRLRIERTGAWLGRLAAPGYPLGAGLRAVLGAGAAGVLGELLEHPPAAAMVTPPGVPQPPAGAMPTPGDRRTGRGVLTLGCLGSSRGRIGPILPVPSPRPPSPM
jgi:hypothetical protein